MTALTSQRVAQERQPERSIRRSVGCLGDAGTAVRSAQTSVGAPKRARKYVAALFLGLSGRAFGAESLRAVCLWAAMPQTREAHPFAAESRELRSGSVRDVPPAHLDATADVVSIAQSGGPAQVWPYSVQPFRKFRRGFVARPSLDDNLPLQRGGVGWSLRRSPQLDAAPTERSVTVR